MFSCREVVVTPCRIFYKFESKKVFLLQVMRQKQDLRRYIHDQAMKNIDSLDFGFSEVQHW
jgi:hypothetical protein